MMVLMYAMVGLCLGMLVFSVLCAILAIFAYAKVVGFEKSTHQIEYRDPNEMFKDMDDENEDFAEGSFEAPDNSSFNPFVAEQGTENIPMDSKAMELQKKKQDREYREALVGEDDTLYED